MVATGGIYAPTIRHHNGTTYIVCTNIVHHGHNLEDGEHAENFIIHTDDIWSDHWSDPVYYKFDGIDPSLLFDDDGKVYIQGSKTPEFQIYNTEIDIKTGAVLTEPKVIWTGWDKRFTEGPHVYKRDGWYYLMCAEGGTFTYHMLSVARSRSIWGPYDAYDKNPLVTAFETQNYIQHTGHGDLVEDAKGQWWAVMLGVRLRDGRFTMGRETFISPAEWPRDGWPSIKQVFVNPVEGKDTTLEGTPDLSAKPGVDWVYLRDPDLSLYSIGEKTISITASAADLTCPDDSVSWIGKRQRRLSGSATVQLRFKDVTKKNLQAGIALYKDEHRFVAIGVDLNSSQIYLQSKNAAKKFSKDIRHDVSVLDGLHVRITYTEMAYSFSFKQHESEGWEELDSIDTLQLTDFDFTGPIIGVYAVGSGQAGFDDLCID